MLLRNRSRAVTKPGLMADHTSHPSHRQNYYATSPIPKFRELSTKRVCASGFEAFTLRTPTSILDSRSLNLLSLSPVGFSHQPQPIPISSHSSKGLALLTSLQIQQNSANPNVLFGTQLGVKIPPSSKEDQSVVCWSEMKNCEEYTCVKAHGPNPTTTHIFHNCIIVIDTPHHNTYSSSDSASTATTNFLTFCYTCKIHLDHTRDIFIYRGEKAFCSEECRYREMVLDGGEESSEFDSNGHASSL